MRKRYLFSRESCCKSTWSFLSFSTSHSIGRVSSPSLSLLERSSSLFCRWVLAVSLVGSIVNVSFLCIMHDDVGGFSFFYLLWSGYCHQQTVSLEVTDRKSQQSVCWVIQTHLHRTTPYLLNLWYKTKIISSRMRCRHTNSGLLRKEAHGLHSTADC